MSLEQTNQIVRWYKGWDKDRPKFSLHELQRIDYSVSKHRSYVNHLSKQMGMPTMRIVMPSDMYFFEELSFEESWYTTFYWLWCNDRYEKMPCRFEQTHLERQKRLWEVASKEFIQNTGPKDFTEEVLLFFKKITKHENIFLLPKINPYNTECTGNKGFENPNPKEAKSQGDVKMLDQTDFENVETKTKSKDFLPLVDKCKWNVYLLTKAVRFPSKFAENPNRPVVGVWWVEEKRPVIMDLKGTFIDVFKAYAQKKVDFSKMSFEVGRTGQGLTDTRYSIVPLPTDALEGYAEKQAAALSLIEKAIENIKTKGL